MVKPEHKTMTITTDFPSILDLHTGRHTLSRTNYSLPHMSSQNNEYYSTGTTGTLVVVEYKTMDNPSIFYQEHFSCVLSPDRVSLVSVSPRQRERLLACLLAQTTSKGVATKRFWSGGRRNRLARCVVCQQSVYLRPSCATEPGSVPSTSPSTNSAVSLVVSISRSS